MGYAVDGFGLPTAVILFAAVVTLAAMTALGTTGGSIDHHAAEAVTTEA